MTPEGKVKQRIKSFLKEVGAWQYWPVSNGMGVHGIPDCICCYKGMFYAFEVKAPGKREHKRRGATALQSIQIKSINDAGGVSQVVDCVSEVKELLCL